MTNTDACNGDLDTFELLGRGATFADKIVVRVL